MDKIIIPDLDLFKQTQQKINEGAFKECYTYNKDNVALIFKNPYRHTPYGHVDDENINNLSKLKTKYFHFANGKFYYNNELCGLRMKYINGQKLSHGLPNFILLKDIYEDYKNAIEEIKYLSKNHIVIHDVAKRNIIYNKNGFNFIDTDNYSKQQHFSEKRIFRNTKHCFDDSLLKTLIDLDDDKVMEIIINNRKLQKIHENHINLEEIDLILFLETLKKEIQKYSNNNYETIECFKQKIKG